LNIPLAAANIDPPSLLATPRVLFFFRVCLLTFLLNSHAQFLKSSQSTSFSTFFLGLLGLNTLSPQSLAHGLITFFQI